MQLDSPSLADKLGKGLTVALWTGFAAAIIAAITGKTGFNGLSLTIAALTLFVAATCAAFSLRYMRADANRLSFVLTMGSLVASVLAAALTGSLIVLALAWCASGLLLARLIHHDRSSAEACAASGRARLALLIGDVSLVAALGLLALWTGTTEISGALAAAKELSVLQASEIAALLLIAAAARCALPPFAGWLLSSMTAPTPVSALMHAGLVNAGGFLLIRFAPIFEAAPMVRLAAMTLGLFAAIYGVAVMLVRPDVKRSLAGSTVSQMGFMIMSCGLGAYAAALWHLVAHGLFKAWLFLGSGSTIGMKQPIAAQFKGGKGALLIAVAALAAASLLLAGENASAGVVPLILGGATAAMGLFASLKAGLPNLERVKLAMAIAGLASFHMIGLSVIGLAAGADAAPIISPLAVLALLAIFLAVWVWQMRHVARSAVLPAPLYVRLLNAGALNPARNGEK